MSDVIILNFRLLIVTVLFSLSAVACSSNPRYDWAGADQTTDENGCYTIETYDSDDDFCYLSCDNLNSEQCDDLALQIYGEFEEFINEDFEGDNNAAEENLIDSHIASYSVDVSLKLSEITNAEPENADMFQRIWRAVLAILPENVLRNEVVEFHINTDGLDNTLAYVTLHETIPEKWVMAIDSADYISEKNKDFIHTVIHEFAHIVFLNKSQVDIESAQACSNYSFTEGCSKSDSYINAFYSRFWATIIKDNPSALADIDATSEDEITEFYEQYQSHFVSDYAATNPIEDAAEIFVHFVLGKKPQLTTVIQKQKIEFLYEFPELVELRSKIRAKLRNTPEV